MSSTAKAQATQSPRSDMVREALVDSGTRAADFKAGMVYGVHYLELVEPIKQLKREGRFGSPRFQACSAGIAARGRSMSGRSRAATCCE